MNIVITGSSSGVGQELCRRLTDDHVMIAPTRDQLDLKDIDAVMKFDLNCPDMLINCAGTGIGGKTDFINHSSEDIVEILTTNLLSPVLLTRSALKRNSDCKIVNITSTNNNRYWPNDLAYSLSKQALSDFNSMLKVEYPNVNLLEIRLGLTKTNFNNNRYKNEPTRYDDIYQFPHLTVEDAVDRILDVLFLPKIKFIEISP